MHRQGGSCHLQSLAGSRSSQTRRSAVKKIELQQPWTPRMASNEFKGWLHAYLPPALESKTELISKVTDLSFLFGYGPELEEMDIEPGGCGSLRLFLGGTVSLITTPLCSVQSSAGGFLESVAEAQTILLKLGDAEASLHAYMKNYPLPGA